MPVDYRPISVLPLFSTILEKMVIRHHLYPLFRNLPLWAYLSDQFAFRPSGSNSSAIITLVHLITNTLATEPYVHLIALDVSKAFDVAHHLTLFSKLANLSIPDNIYGWLLH